VLIALALLVVPVMMALERLFDRFSALLSARAERKSRRRAVRSTFRSDKK
jgi:hypothetical protein